MPSWNSGVEATDLVPTTDDLLARALEAELVSNSVQTFTHFGQVGWESVAEAFAVSANIVEFLSPGLVSGFVADLLASPQVADSIRGTVVNELASYVSDNNDKALRAAGAYAREKRILLPFAEVKRIARATQDPDVVLPQLVRAKDVSPKALIEVLALLGSPYSTLKSGPEAEFDLPPAPPTTRSSNAWRPQARSRSSRTAGAMGRRSATSSEHHACDGHKLTALSLKAIEPPRRLW